MTSIKPYTSICALRLRCVQAYVFIPPCFAYLSWDTWRNIAPEAVSHNFILWLTAVVVSFGQSAEVDYFQLDRSWRSCPRRSFGAWPVVIGVVQNTLPTLFGFNDLISIYLPGLITATVADTFPAAIPKHTQLPILS